jgi:hypothetical protein
VANIARQGGQVKKLLLCLLLSAYTALVITPMQWEKDARRQWKELANAIHEETNDIDTSK